MPALRRLQFSAFCNTQFGQYVSICGNIPQLGNWNPLKGLRLYTQESLYPMWRSYNSILVIQNQPVQFKIVIISSKNEFKWQNIVQNRLIIPQIDAYLRLTANQFERYEIFPFSDGNQLVRTGIDILNDLQSDGSSSISFKSNYKFFQYFQRKDNVSQNSASKPKNTSTFRDLGQLQIQKKCFKTQNQFVTFFDSLVQLENQTKKQITTQQDCSNDRIQKQKSNSTSSNKQEQYWNKQDWSLYCPVTENGNNNVHNSAKKNNQYNVQGRLTSLNKIVYSNSSQSLSFIRDQ